MTGGEPLDHGRVGEIAVCVQRRLESLYALEPESPVTDYLVPVDAARHLPGGGSRTLVAQAYRPLAEATGSVLETLSAYLGTGRSLEAAARSLYVHPNTVRYRLRKVSEITGWDPLDARESFVLQVALALGQLAGSR